MFMSELTKVSFEDLYLQGNYNEFDVGSMQCVMPFQTSKPH